MATITRVEAAYHSFVQGVAYRTGRSEDEVCADTSQDDFLETLQTLHAQYMAGEFSIGRLAERLGIDPFRLDFLLTTLGLPVHN